MSAFEVEVEEPPPGRKMAFWKNFKRPEPWTPRQLIVGACVLTAILFFLLYIPRRGADEVIPYLTESLVSPENVTSESPTMPISASNSTQSPVFENSTITDSEEFFTDSTMPTLFDILVNSTETVEPDLAASSTTEPFMDNSTSSHTVLIFRNDTDIITLLNATEMYSESVTDEFAASNVTLEIPTDDIPLVINGSIVVEESNDEDSNSTIFTVPDVPVLIHHKDHSSSSEESSSESSSSSTSSSSSSSSPALDEERFLDYLGFNVYFSFQPASSLYCIHNRQRFSPLFFDFLISLLFYLRCFFLTLISIAGR